MAENSDFLEKIGEMPPNLLMEDDDEVEHCIVKPILENLVEQIHQECRMKSLQKFVDFNMAQICLEKEQRDKEEIIEDILNDVVSKAVEMAKWPKGKLFFVVF